MKLLSLVRIVLVGVILSFSFFAFAEEAVSEKAQTAGNKTSDSVKKTYRAVKDKGCEMINGKLQCVGKKIKHKAENITDEVKTKATEVKNKVD